MKKKAPVDPQQDPIPASVNQLAEIFAGPLAEVTFPDVSKDVLDEACQTVRDQHAEVARLTQELDEAHQAMEAKQEDLVKLANRALAYAKIYAESDESLKEQLSGISLGGGAKKPRAAKPKKVAVPKAQRTAKKKAEQEATEATGEEQAPASEE